MYLRPITALTTALLLLSGCAATINQSGLEQRTSQAIGQLQRQHQERRHLPLLHVLGHRFSEGHELWHDATFGRYLHAYGRYASR